MTVFRERAGSHHSVHHEEQVAWQWNPVRRKWERVTTPIEWQTGAIYAFVPTAPLQPPEQAEPVATPAHFARGGANCHPPALLRTACHLLKAVDAALPQAPHCGEFDALADAAADLTAALAEAQAWAAAGQPAKPAQTPAGTTTRLTSDRVAVVDEAVEWRPMSYCPPRRKVLLLTDGGVAVLGTWDGVATWAIAWAPLPVIPTWLRERLAPVAVRVDQDVKLGVYRHEL